MTVPAFKKIDPQLQLVMDYYGNPSPEALIKESVATVKNGTLVFDLDLWDVVTDKIRAGNILAIHLKGQKTPTAFTIKKNFCIEDPCIRKLCIFKLADKDIAWKEPCLSPKEKKCFYFDIDKLIAEGVRVLPPPGTKVKP